MWLRVKSSKYTTFTLAHSAPGLLIVPGNGPAPGRGVGSFVPAFDGGGAVGYRDEWTEEQAIRGRMRKRAMVTVLLAGRSMFSTGREEPRRCRIRMWPRRRSIRWK